VNVIQLETTETNYQTELRQSRKGNRRKMKTKQSKTITVFPFQKVHLHGVTSPTEEGGRGLMRRTRSWNGSKQQEIKVGETRLGINWREETRAREARWGPRPQPGQRPTVESREGEAIIQTWQ